MRDVKSCCDRTAVRILTAIFEQLAVQGFVKIVYSVVESEQNDLRRLLDLNTTCASQLHYVARDTITEAVIPQRNQEILIAFSKKKRLCNYCKIL